METITSRKNLNIQHFRRLATDAAYRRERGEYICDGISTLREALAAKAVVTGILWREQAQEPIADIQQFLVPKELFSYASFLDNSPGPLFSVKMPPVPTLTGLNKVLVLENVQDPGNVGTVIRAANAFNIDAVLLVGACAGQYSPKVVRSTMAALFRQKVAAVSYDELYDVLRSNGLKLYGAALHRNSLDIRELVLSSCAVAIGSEGKGLSDELLQHCDATVIIPMVPESESLNAAMAATVVMWEMYR